MVPELVEGYINECPQCSNVSAKDADFWNTGRYFFYTLRQAQGPYNSIK